MTPSEFLKRIVEPNIEEFMAAQTDIRRAINAIHCVDDLVGLIHAWARVNAPTRVPEKDEVYRKQLAAKNDLFRAFRDAAAALKHGELTDNTKTPRLLTRASDVRAKAGAFQKSAFNPEAFQSGEAAWLDLNGGVVEVDLAGVLEHAIEMLKREMVSLNCATQ